MYQKRKRKKKKMFVFFFFFFFLKQEIIPTIIFYRGGERWEARSRGIRTKEEKNREVFERLFLCGFPDKELEGKVLSNWKEEGKSDGLPKQRGRKGR